MAMVTGENASSRLASLQDVVAAAEARLRQLQSVLGQIGSVSGLIKDVASQTNLLALNAAIEAARAGEMGRGFAVVADEVRNLAARTSQATVEIVEVVRRNHELAQGAVSSMEASKEKAEQGVTLANEAGQVILEIQDGARQVVQAISQFTATLEQ